MMNSVAKQWLANARAVMDRIEQTQTENIRRAAEVMADSIEAGRWVHTFGCGHATIPVEEMYPRIGGFVGFHPMVELPMTFFTRIVGEMGVHQFLFLERAEGYGVAIMKGYEFDPRDTMWIFSHSGINNVNIDVALEAKKRGMKVIAYGSAAAAKGKKTRHSCGKTIFRYRRSRGRFVRAGGRFVGAAEESSGQGGAGFHDGVRDLRVDDGLHRGGDSGRSRREAVHSSVAQCAGRYHGSRAARCGASRIQAANCRGVVCRTHGGETLRGAKGVAAEPAVPGGVKSYQVYERTVPELFGSTRRSDCRGVS